MVLDLFPGFNLVLDLIWFPIQETTEQRRDKEETTKQRKDKEEKRRKRLKKDPRSGNFLLRMNGGGFNQVNKFVHQLVNNFQSSIFNG